MMKKSFLTPVLSGVLAVTVVGSGVAYYFEFVKDSGGETKDKKDDKSTNITVDEAAENIEAQLDKAQQIAKGELEGGYKAEVTYTAPASGSEIGDISMVMEAKQKDKMSAMDYSIAYNSQTLISANVVYDNESETAYVKIPELSDAYLTGTMDEINAMLESSATGSDPIIYDDEFEGTAYTADAMMVTETSSSPDLSALEDIDFDALFEDLVSYGDTIKENAPEPTDGENRKVEADGASCELTTKVYTITAQDAAKVMTAVADKAKADETLKSTLISMGVTEEDYNSMWDELVSEIDTEDSETVTIEVYYLGEEVAGWSAKGDEEEYYMINAATDTDVIIDWNIVSDGEGVTAKGAVSVDGDTLNGKVNVDILEASYSYDSYDSDELTTTIETTSMEISYNSLTVTDDSAVGELVYTVTADGTEEAKVVVTLNNSGDNFDTSFAISAAGEDAGTISVKSQSTDASDITVPTGTMYKLTDENELNSYLEGCDVEGWQATVKAALGDELYSEIFGSDDYDYDDYDYDDYDFEDYDFDEYDFEDFEDYDLDA